MKRVVNQPTTDKAPARLQTGSFLRSGGSASNLPDEEEIRNTPLPEGYNPNRMAEQDLDDILPIE